MIYTLKAKPMPYLHQNSNSPDRYTFLEKKKCIFSNESETNLINRIDIPTKWLEKKHLVVPNLGRCFGIIQTFSLPGDPIKDDADFALGWHILPETTKKVLKDARKVYLDVTKTYLQYLPIFKVYITGGKIDSAENRKLYSHSYENYVSTLEKEFGDRVSIYHLPPSKDTDSSKLIMTKNKVVLVQEDAEEKKVYAEITHNIL